MQLYGDPHVEVDLARLWSELGARVTRLDGDPPTDALRELVIATGEMEQAAHDALAGAKDHRAHPFVARTHALTSLAAQAFHSDWLRAASAAGATAGATRWHAPREYVHALKREVRARPELRRSILKIPEGFAYGAVYPEQYCAAAWAWLGATKEKLTGSVLVIGVRSIGTTLSAVVAAALDSAGIDNNRITVRPTGPAGARELTFEPSVIKGISHAIVVDEGPWTSGTSMASVAFALEALGMPRASMAFMPSHRDGPGAKASREVLALWDQVPTYCVPITAPIFGGLPLREHLLKEVKRTLGVSAEILPEEDWRQLAYLNQADWPTGRGRFGALRYRARTPSGVIALEFCGTAVTEGHSMVAQTLAACEKRTFAGFAAAPIGMAVGFLVRPWVDGVALRIQDLDTQILSGLAVYVASMAGHSLDTEGLAAAHQRRAEWAANNLANALGESAARRAGAYVEAGAVLPYAWTRASFDYELAPRCWMRTSDGIARMGGTASVHGHTVVGVQPVLWDVASLLVEWNLDRYQARALVSTLEEALGGELPRPALRAFMLAYIAFRLGELNICQESTSDAAELSRIHEAIGVYCKQVDRLLQ